MATDKDILTGVFTRMGTLATSLPIAWPGVNFTPPNSGMWLQIRHFPNEPNNIGWQTDAQQEYIGFVQVQVFTRPGTGIVNATEIAEEVIAHFAKGTEFGPVCVSRRPYTSPDVVDSDWIYIPVTIPYRGIT